MRLETITQKTVLTPLVMINMIAIMLLSACAPSAKAPPFNPALDKYFAAIATRDIQAYTDTITTGETLPFIFPDGSMLSTRQQVIDFHTTWFADPNWRMEFASVSQIVGSDIATAIFKTGYRDTPDGQARYGYLALTFQLQDGTWRLVQDQNTRITSA